MGNARKHYMTICTRNNTQVYYIYINGVIEIYFEQGYSRRIKTLVLENISETKDIYIIKNSGFNSAEVAYFVAFAERHIDII